MQITVVYILERAWWSLFHFWVPNQRHSKHLLCRYPGSLKGPGVEHQIMEALRITDLELSISPNANKCETETDLGTFCWGSSRPWQQIHKFLIDIFHVLLFLNAFKSCINRKWSDGDDRLFDYIMCASPHNCVTEHIQAHCSFHVNNLHLLGSSYTEYTGKTYL